MAAEPERLTTVISTKGQVILPKAIRERRHWASGTRLVVEDTAEGVMLKRAPLFAETSIGEVFGSLAYDGPAVPPDALEAALAAEAKRRARD
jgi:AbrB family looped-hinge helix DNA binding protein